MKKTNYWNILTYFIYAIVIIFAFLAISAKFSIGEVKLLVVMSGSMEPAIKTGSMVIDKEFKSYNIGDIITFKNQNNLSETTTHRIFGEEDKDGKKLFITKGDANNSPDAAKINPDLIVGKVVFKIPYFGYAVAFARTMWGIIILIVIPATIIIYDEINKIKEEVKKRKKRGKKVKNGKNS